MFDEHGFKGELGLGCGCVGRIALIAELKEFVNLWTKLQLAWM